MSERPEEQDLARQERIDLMSRLYELFPDLGPALNRALTQGTGEDAMRELETVSSIGASFDEGTYQTVEFRNEANGRRFTLKIFEKSKSDHKFTKDVARFAFSVSYNNLAFKE